MDEKQQKLAGLKARREKRIADFRAKCAENREPETDKQALIKANTFLNKWMRKTVSKIK